MWDLFHHPLTTDEKYAIFAFAVLVGMMCLAAYRMRLAHVRETREAADSAALKMEMVQRGMSAAEIERVLAAKVQPQGPSVAGQVGRAAGDLVRRAIE